MFLNYIAKEPTGYYKNSEFETEFSNNPSMSKIVIWIKFLVIYIGFCVLQLQGSHTGQLDFCNWLADGSTMG